MNPAGKRVIPISKTSDIVTLYAIGDCHIGNSGCALDLLREDVNRVKADPNARAILMGDLADYIGPADKRWNAHGITPEARVSDLADWGMYLARQVVKEFRPIKHKIIGALYGNHEAKFETAQSQQLHSWACQELGIMNLGYSCFLDLIFARNSANAKYGVRRRYRISAHHGRGAARSDGGKINTLVSFMNMYEADVYLVGHLHEKDIKRKDVLGADDKCEALRSKKRIGLFSGTYLKTYSEGVGASYGEQAGYAPVPLGCARIEFRPFSRDWKHREESVSARVAI